MNAFWKGRRFFAGWTSWGLQFGTCLGVTSGMLKHSIKKNQTLITTWNVWNFGLIPLVMFFFSHIFYDNFQMMHLCMITVISNLMP